LNPLSRSEKDEPKVDESAADALEEELLSAEAVRQRAVTGVAVDVVRAIGARFLGLFGILVLARLLTPQDFGMVAVGATFVTFANFVADGGIGVTLIRRAEPPTRADLKALLAFQLGLSTGLALCISAVLIPFGTLGQVTALMVAALPLMAVRVPGAILLERQLNFRPLALVEIVETIVYYTWAIGMVEAGWGVWGLASGYVVRAFVGSTLLLCMVPSGRMIPSPSWERVRTLLGFGFRYQTVAVTNMLRELGVNTAVAVIAGVSALGVWSVAHRILQIPLILLNSLWRVSFPGMSRLVAAGENVGGTIERVVAIAAVISGLILAPLVAATPAWIPALLGSQWNDAIPVIPPASLHLMVMGPISAALIGYLWAIGDASAVLRAALAGIPLMAIVMLPLLAVIGVPAVGFGWLATGVGEATVLIMSARKHVEFRIKPRLVPPTIFAVLGALVGWVVSVEVGPTFFGGLAGGLSAAIVYLCALWLWHRSYLLDSVQLSIRGLRTALKSPAL
jgi:O-antigen/teichoic acid export membrane protein